MQTELKELKKALEERSEEVQVLSKTLAERSRELEVQKRSSEAELEELTEALEERSREVDESMDKYCSLMVRVHKLEETNETLKTRLERFVTHTTSSTANNASNTANNASNKTPRRKSGRRSAARAQEALIPLCPAEMDSENTMPAGQGSLGKRGCGALAASDNTNTPFKAQEALLNTAKRIKATATTPRPGSRQEEEELRPEGLPELVQRGETWEHGEWMMDSNNNFVLIEA